MKRFLLPLFLFLSAISIETAAIEETLLVDLVDLYFTATNEKGQFITDLHQDEITVTEDGVSQKIQRFGAFAGERNEIPMILALVLDNSASMDSKMDEVRKLDLARDAALVLLEELGPLDRVKLVQFSDILKSTELTSDKEMIRAELKKINPRWWQTAMFDAVASTIKDLNAQSGRKILLLCSDGQDNMSKTKLEEVADLAARTPDLTVIVLGTVADVPVIGLRGRVKTLPATPMFRGREILQSLADKTAGYAFFPKNLKESEKVRALLGSFVRSQYYLAYRSTNQKLDGSFRKIVIQCKRKGIKLRYRAGYYAS